MPAVKGLLIVYIMYGYLCNACYQGFATSLIYGYLINACCQGFATSLIYGYLINACCQGFATSLICKTFEYLINIKLVSFLVHCRVWNYIFSFKVNSFYDHVVKIFRDLIDGLNVVFFDLRIKLLQHKYVY